MSALFQKNKILKSPTGGTRMVRATSCLESNAIFERIIWRLTITRDLDDQVNQAVTVHHVKCNITFTAISLTRSMAHYVDVSPTNSVPFHSVARPQKKMKENH